MDSFETINPTGLQMNQTMINTRYPGRPNYIGPLKGGFAFVHHKVLAELSSNINERIAYINSDKPKHEVESRLYHLLYVDIPELTKDWDKAREDWDKANEDWDKACKDWDKVIEDCDKDL